MDYEARRKAMVRHQLASREITEKDILRTMSEIPRHKFVPQDVQHLAYEDHPLPIGHGQTISQPYIVALMTQLLELSGDEKVLEIGTGSGYQAAVLSKLAGQVYTIEIVPELGRRSKKLLSELGYRNVTVRIGDGYKGWPEKAPFDRIILTASPPRIPRALLNQLSREKGVLVAPEGDYTQELITITRTGNTYERERHGFVRFVPMVPGR